MKVWVNEFSRQMSSVVEAVYSVRLMMCSVYDGMMVEITVNTSEADNFSAEADNIFLFQRLIS